MTSYVENETDVTFPFDIQKLVEQIICLLYTSDAADILLV